MVMNAMFCLLGISHFEAKVCLDYRSFGENALILQEIVV